MTDSDIEERVTSLKFWCSRPVIEPLSGGITNRNYRASADGEEFVVRVCNELPHLGIDRKNETLCQTEAHQAGVAPGIVYSEPGILVSEFVEGETLTKARVSEPEMTTVIARTVRIYHGYWDKLRGELLYFCPFQTIRTYMQTALSLLADLPGDIDCLVIDSQELSHKMSPYRPTLCHNDLLAANFIAGPKKMWIVDWEYAGIGNPLFDLASISSNASFSTEQDEFLLQAYRGTTERTDLFELRALKTVSLLREALWSMIQTVTSELDFDYVEYARTNFEAYKEARASLSAGGHQLR